MDPTIAAILGGVAGLVIAALAWWALTSSDRERSEPAPTAPSLPAGVGDVLAVLRSSGIVVDGEDRVVNNSPAAVAHGLVRNRRLAHPALAELTEAARADGVIREVELELHRPGDSQGAPGTFVHARVAPLGDRHVLLLVEDMTQARRVEAVRRDFVANVSHELKTPVGGLGLLAEAVLDARDDPEAVTRFATRMQVESQRLSSLVKEIVDLSRLQGAEVLSTAQRVDIERVVDEALDHLRVTANARRISLADKCADELYVLGDHALLVTAIRNLVGNAIAYSDEGTRVGVGARLVGEMVEITVTDQGPGIPEHEQERIFERFYRIDAARSRATGGTGLGLAIVKHVCANHGGDISVWSEPGEGSTFTVRLPAAPETIAAHREQDQSGEHEREHAR
ncbi:ATP-binding protein [Marihabitans asiaticum]|uniref:Sensor-like histidine kinase SenX3 n=1 Tax=Marihabitans asiaticum TaxID=415218 RepID=A0A560WHS6_9MICO|nr:ATP-binding protein [Marihabitans asiaticum]TWD17005.1 two-component system sensor histidine kinase SenX3 [Marihabitans asiaticum]